MDYIVTDDILISTGDICNFRCDENKCLITVGQNGRCNLISTCSKNLNPDSYKKLANPSKIIHSDQSNTTKEKKK